MADRPRRAPRFALRAYELSERPEVAWRDLVPHIASGALAWQVPEALGTPEPDADPESVAMLLACSEATLRAPRTAPAIRVRLTPFAATCRAWLAERGRLDLLPTMGPADDASP